MSWTDASTRARAAHYAATKGSKRHEREQRRASNEAVEDLVRFGYGRARARRAVQEYAAAARGTKLGPDWRGWLTMVKAAGLVEPGHVSGLAAELHARQRGQDTP